MTDETKAKYTSVPWAQIVGLRNRLIHGYDAVDMGILWEILTQDIPDLIRALESIGGLESET